MSPASRQAARVLPRTRQAVVRSGVQVLENVLDLHELRSWVVLAWLSAPYLGLYTAHIQRLWTFWFVYVLTVFALPCRIKRLGHTTAPCRQYWGKKLRHCAEAGRSRVWFPMRSLDFSIDVILPAALWPWGQLSLYEKWVSGIFVGGKWRPALKADNLTAICEPIV
jgi:hypothetical protein